MTDHDALLAAIRANPADRTMRLVYADWLEERDDPRHELVRVCERMRRVPVFADEYWQLKLRRNELRAGCDAAWLAATGYDGGDYDPVFRDGVPDGWRERWRLIREFTERWYGITMPDVGGRRDEVRATEERLGLTLPPSVREWVAYAHDLPPYEHGILVHRDWYTMEKVAGHPNLSLLLQAEGDFHWTVRKAELGLPDPPVHRLIWDYEFNGPDEDRPFVPYHEDAPEPTITAFVLDYTFQYKPSAGMFRVDISGPNDLPPGWDEIFPIRVNELGLYEGNNLLSVVSLPNEWRREWQLDVSVREGTSAESVPRFLWELARRSNPTAGFFHSEENSYHWVEHIRRISGESDIPF